MTWELQQLVQRYAAHVDDRLPVAPLFTAAGALVLPDPPEVLDPVRVCVGPEAIEAAMQALAGIPRTFHAVVGMVFEVEGATATGRIACVAHHVLDAKTDLVWHLRYLDTYAFEDQWLIARREVHLDLVETRQLKRARLT